jgi:Rieske Fe-S protein
LAELQRDPISRAQFLTMGIVGSLVGAVLTIPPTVYLLSPTIQTNFQGRSDIPNEWVEAGSVWEIPSGAPMEFRVEFSQKQTYDAGQPGAEEEPSPEGVPPNVGTAINTVLVSWRDGKLPGILEDNGGTQTLSTPEVEELSRRINVLSNHCAHLGCPTRWQAEKGLIVCPCHGGEYDINGGYRAGPPPHGLFRFAYEIREDGSLYVKHDFTNGRPWVV